MRKKNGPNETLENGYSIKFGFDRKVSPSTPKKMIHTMVSVGAVCFIIEQIEHRYTKISNELIQKHEEEIAGGKNIKSGQFVVHYDRKNINLIIGQSWDLIDWADRLRKILGNAAGVDRRSQEYKKLLSELNNTSAMRDSMQHFNSDMHKNVEDCGPMMGSVYAFFPVNSGKPCCRMLLSSPKVTSFHKETTVHGVQRFPLELNRNIDCVSLSLLDQSVNLTAIYDNLVEFKGYFYRYIKKEYKCDWNEVSK